MATNKNLYMDQGSSFTESIRYLDNFKNPISLVGYSIKSQMRKSYYSANAITFVSILSDGPGGNIIISLDFNTTGNISPGRYVYDVKANTANTAIKIQEGIITVNPGVTK